MGGVTLAGMGMTDGIRIAKINGTAARMAHALHGAPSPAVRTRPTREQAVAEIVAATDGRTDLLDRVAGELLGAWEADQVTYWIAERAVPLLRAAGADGERMEPWRVAMREELTARASRRGGEPWNAGQARQVV
ncbi:hypothetical protein [Nocardioides maradonensis]